MKRALLIALVMLCWPASAGAVQIDSPNPIYQQWADAAKVPTPDGTVEVVEVVCPDGISPGCTAEFTIWLTPPPNRPIFLHELGHVFALQRGFPYGLTIASERFADSYTLCATGWTRANTFGRHHQWVEGPTALAFRVRALRRTCRTIRSSLLGTWREEEAPLYRPVS